MDLADVEELVALHRQDMDLARIDALVRQVAKVLEDPGRVSTWERIVRRT